MKIRKARKRDIKEYIILRKKTFGEWKIKDFDDNKIKKEFNLFLNSEKKVFLVVENEGKIIGYLIATMLQNIWQKSSYLDDIFIDKKFRRKGIGMNLIKEYLKRMKKRGIKKIRLGVDIKNNKGIKLYKKAGFKIKQYEMEKRLK